MSYYFKKYEDCGDILEWLWRDFMPKEDENIIQDEEKWVYEVVKPRLKKECLKVNLIDKKLVIDYNQPNVTKDKLECANFHKEWIVKDNITKDDVKVKYEGGVLTIVVKASISTKVESIEIPIE